ncbi:4-hydroxythreonine-4-phosphate dehydrogenase PdxA [Parvibium lacunae]|uniref:4-hydroxythreonine-4-phosphate dehydrogenase n=1 Tax=Parvibium lacunae TaxID=1888893 RepID=A0A368L490_9BURK|nr:4-hydroxythreonine-4-phosphate dehydrogenase PdxA [Parvibium lacunae]RCS58389.1 4-hydroxythreonine-4-phosphate dehydrogenase PdxA [Parvibium lacunae]
MSLTLAITCGEPAGIGPEISLRAVEVLRAAYPDVRFVLIADRGMLTVRARRLGLSLRLSDYQPQQAASLESIEVLHQPLGTSCQPGQLNPANARYVLQSLDAAIQGAQAGRFSAIVTAPIQKSVINEAGIKFSGHTEYLAQQCKVKRVVMMLASEQLKVALATTHLALKEVPNALTYDSILDTLRILHNSLRQQFALRKPRIIVTGLNPHAGEDGYLGREEIDVIRPAVKAAQAEDIQVLGPLPADTVFTPKYTETCDAVLAMYHDQGLPVLKYASFGQAVNITLGLPIIRTSVDHGTALDIAGSGKADHSSMLAAAELALKLAQNKFAQQAE